MVGFERDQRKDDVAASYHAAFDADEGVVFIGVAQEKASSLGARAGEHRAVVGEHCFPFSRFGTDLRSNSQIVVHFAHSWRSPSRPAGFVAFSP